MRYREGGGSILSRCVGELFVREGGEGEEEGEGGRYMVWWAWFAGILLYRRIDYVGVSVGGIGAGISSRR